MPERACLPTSTTRKRRQLEPQRQPHLPVLHCLMKKLPLNRRDVDGAEAGAMSPLDEAQAADVAPERGAVERGNVPRGLQLVVLNGVREVPAWKTARSMLQPTDQTFGQ